MRGILRLRTGIPVSGIPVPGRANPYIAAPYKPLRIRLRILGSASPTARIPGDPDLERILGIYVSRLSEVLETPISVYAGVEGEAPRVSIYEALTRALLRGVARAAGIDIGGEEREYLSILDASTGFSPEYLDLISAVRESAARNMLVAYRRDEGVVEIPGRPMIHVVRCIDRSLRMDREIEELLDAAVHLAGLTTIRIGERLREPPLSPALFRMENALWHALYGVEIFGDYKIIPDLGGICYAEIRD